MNSITIAVQGDELEVINIELSTEEVLALYKLRKENSVKIADLEKKVADLERSYKWATERANYAEGEIAQANTLLTALGVQEKNDAEESYNRKDLPVMTRFALYIAKEKK